MSQEAVKKLKTTIQVNGGETPENDALYPRELYIDKDGYLWVGDPTNDRGDADEPSKATRVQKVKAEAAELVVGTEGVLYGSTLPRAADLKEGQVFFLVEE